MNIQDFFNQNKIIELSFFNFENAITAAYFANQNLEVQKVNKNFKNFFPVLGEVTNAYFPHIYSSFRHIISFIHLYVQL